MAEDPVKIIKRFDSLKRLRQPFESHWESLAEVMMPRMRGMRGGTLQSGQKLTDHQYDVTPTEAGEKLVSFLHGAMMSTSFPFFGLQMRDQRLMDIKAISDWLEDCADLLMGAFSQSNWDAESPEALVPLVFLGTSSPLYLDERPIKFPGQRFGGLRFKALPFAECWLAENDQGVIDTCFWKHSLPAESIVRLWRQRCSPSVQSLSRNSPYEPVELLLAIYPREVSSQQPWAFSHEFPWAACYIEMNTRTLLEERGYREFPAPVARWSRSNFDPVYGRGRGDTAYPDVRVLNEATRYELMAWPLSLWPPYMKDSGFAGKVRWLPGAEHEISGKSLAGGLNPPIQPIDQRTKWDVAQLKKEEYRESIKRVFFWHLTELPEQGPQMTAREVQIRVRIMQRALGVDPGRIKSEILEPTIGRAFNMMLRAGALPPPPQELFELAGEEGSSSVDIIYKGPLVMSQRADDVMAIDAHVDYVLAAFERTQDPSVLDTLDMDEAAWARGEASSIPGKILRGKDQVAEMRQQRAQTQAEQQAMEQRQQMTDEMLRAAQAGKMQAETEQAAGGGV